jgi:hypothetical protein
MRPSNGRATWSLPELCWRARPCPHQSSRRGTACVTCRWFASRLSSLQVLDVLRFSALVFWSITTYQHTFWKQHSYENSVRISHPVFMDAQLIRLSVMTCWQIADPKHRPHLLRGLATCAFGTSVRSTLGVATGPRKNPEPVITSPRNSLRNLADPWAFNDFKV